MSIPAEEKVEEIDVEEVEKLATETQFTEMPPERKPRAPVDEIDLRPMPNPKRFKRRRARSKSSSSSWSMPSIVVSPTIITGLLMMAGAVVWFFGALALGWIFFYPPIMFVLGLAAVIRRLMGQEDD
jgi:hypothetical protein